MSPCRCRKGSATTTTTTTVPGPAVTVDGGVRFALHTSDGATMTFDTELQARAFRARTGNGRIYRI